MGFLAGMLKRFAMCGLVALWVAMSAFQASAAVSAGGSHHGHAAVAAGSMATAATPHAHHQDEASAHGHDDATAEQAGSPRPCHAPDGNPVSADLSCCAAMCQAADIVPVFHTMTGVARSTSYGPALAECALAFAAPGLERPPR